MVALVSVSSAWDYPTSNPPPAPSNGCIDPAWMMASSSSNTNGVTESSDYSQNSMFLILHFTLHSNLFYRILAVSVSAVLAS